MQFFSAYLSTQLKYNKKKIQTKKAWWFALQCIVEFLFLRKIVVVFVYFCYRSKQPCNWFLSRISGPMAVNDNEPRMNWNEKKNKCSTCPPKYPRYMRNCYYVALKNLLLSLRFCTYLQLISISIYFSLLLLLLVRFIIFFSRCHFLFRFLVCHARRPK